jgi:RNA polymerase sigma-70 factor (ECF subfamily)
MNATELAEAVERARRGEREGFAELYQEFGRRVLGLCRHLLGSPEVAEDARSDVFLRLPRAIDRYDPALPFDRWLLSVTSHHCLDVLRRRRLESRLFAAEWDETDGVGGKRVRSVTPRGGADG